MKKFNLQEWLEFHKFASNLYAYPYDEQLQILKDMKKVQYIQGYYYDKPLTEEAFEKKYL